MSSSFGGDQEEGDCQDMRHRADGRMREYATPEDLPSSATYSQIRENAYYSKDKATCYWPHIKNKKHQVTPQAVCLLFTSYDISLFYCLLTNSQAVGAPNGA